MLSGSREIQLKELDTVLAESALRRAEVLNDLKDHLLICLLKSRADAQGRVTIPAAALDASGNYLVAFRMENGVLDFIVSAKD
jgi:hypothetical protein